jgi:hypothetical protein
MFTKEGNFTVTMKEVVFSPPKFAENDPNAFDVNIRVETEDGQSDWWRGEMSTSFGKGNVAHLTQAQLTMQTLGKLGFEGYDLTSLADSIVGKTTTAWVKASTPTADGKVFYNVRGLGGSGGSKPEEIGMDAVKAKMAALMGGTQAAPQSAPQAAPQPAPYFTTANPFGPPSTNPTQPAPFKSPFG